MQSVVFSPELLVQARAAADASALAKLMRANDYPLTTKQAQRLYDRLHDSVEVGDAISDDALEGVVGGVQTYPGDAARGLSGTSSTSDPSLANSTYWF